MNYAVLETKKISTIVINKAINKQLANGIEIDELFIINKNVNNEIETIDFNPSIVNKLLNVTTNVVLVNLKAIENGDMEFIEFDNTKNGVIYNLPLGVITNNTFISNIGPKIPIKLNVIGAVESNINTNIKEYGINNALIEVSVKIKVTLMVNVPFISKKEDVICNIPIAIKVIQGEVPKYYGGNLSKDSNIFSIPID